ncbi:MAG: nicotinate (nicotinamide) nucleotide adenylyltransferase [Bacteroidales bacterium]|nr:nicotinate (nicotinamide) nucleotide adenylyltransferase [Bacteroidales bacterium]
MRIAVYPGSFNPLHIGHQAIMEYLTKEEEYDWVYLVVSPKNPIKTTIKAETARDRYEAAVAAVKRHPDLHVWVDDIELNMEPPQYTIKTLDTLRQREPENDFTLVVGADNLENIHRWRDFQRILADYGVAVYPRKGYDLAEIKSKLIEECRHLPAPYVLDSNEYAEEGRRSLEETLRDTYNIKILEAPIVDISSTQIREGIAEGRDMSEWMM